MCLFTFGVIGWGTWIYVLLRLMRLLTWLLFLVIVWVVLFMFVVLVCDVLVLNWFGCFLGWLCLPAC